MVGVSANYSEEIYTQTVYRIEAPIPPALPMGMDTRDPRGVPLWLDKDRNSYKTTEQTLLMLAFDRLPGFGR